MGNLFGVRRRAPQITAQDRTILQLKQQRDRIKIYQKKTESELVRNQELALKLYQNGMKDRAIVVLRRKKMMEDILGRTDKQLETLQQLVSDIEYTQIEVSVVEGLRVGTEALKQLNSLMNIDEIQEMMEDNAEAAEKQREITSILQQSSERYDEQDLLKELETYQKEQQPPEKPRQIEPEPAPEQEAPFEEVEPAPREELLTEKLPEEEPAREETATIEIDNLPSVPEIIEIAEPSGGEPSGEGLEESNEPQRKAMQVERKDQENIRPKGRRKMLADSS